MIKPIKAVGAIGILAICILQACSRQYGHEYFPLTPGLTWRYAMSYETMDGPGRALYLIENLPVKQGNDEDVFVRQSLDGRMFHYQVKEDGVLLTRREKTVDLKTSEETADQYVFKFPLEVGQQWESISKTRVLLKTGPPQKTEFRIVVNVPVTVRIEAMDDTVTVPAGTFKDCMRISLKGDGFFNVGNYVGMTVITVDETSWYAPNVGLVKLVRKETTSSKALDRGEVTYELASLKSG